MTLEAELRAILIADSGISALVGARIYPGVLPQNPTLPALTYEKVSDIAEQTLNGPLTFSSKRLQFDCWGGAKLDVIAVAEALRAKLHGFSGNLGGSPPTYLVSGIFLANEQDMPFENDTKLFRISADYFLYVDVP